MSSGRFQKHVANKKDLFIPFIMAGDPNIESTIELALMLEKAGADILELGIPYSDPLADGPVIQRSAARALKNGMTLEGAMKLVPQMRERGLQIPVVIFTYFNPLLQFGEERFITACHEYDIDGALVPDLPFEESEKFAAMCEENQLAYISLVAPTSRDRVAKIAANAKGFLYCVSSLGVTGVRNDLDQRIYEFLADVRQHAKVPVAVGFGISKKEHVLALKDHCDGFIVGSAIIRQIEEQETLLSNESTRQQAVQEIEKFVVSLLPS